VSGREIFSEVELAFREVELDERDSGVNVALVDVGIVAAIDVVPHEDHGVLCVELRELRERRRQRCEIAVDVAHRIDPLAVGHPRRHPPLEPVARPEHRLPSTLPAGGR